MKKRIFAGLLILAMCIALAACGGESKPEAALPDGSYTAEFKTDSSMFHVNETLNGIGLLTVENGKMTIHVTLAGKGILNLYPGTAEDAQKEGAVLLQPTTDIVNYPDGTSEEVYGFDIPVPCLDEEFDCALVGNKGTWYDHKVSVSNPVEVPDTVADGEYTMEVTLTGGSGRASIQSPARIIVDKGEFFAEIVWSSPNYEYMKIGDIQYDPTQTEGNSTFLIPITPDTDIAVSALTTAMSEPHLIDYVLHFDGSTLK